MRDRQRWMCRSIWGSVFVAFHLLTILQCSYTHRKVPQRNTRQAPAAQETADGVPGVWSSWGPWSSCSSSCGMGVAEQSRRCQPRPAGGQRRTHQPEVLYAAPRPDHGDSQWDPYTGRGVSALRPTYSLHVDGETPEFGDAGQSPDLRPQHGRPPSTGAEEPPGRRTLPLYGDQFAPDPLGDGAYGEPAPRQRYRPSSNRGSVPLYRQGQPSNHDRQQPAANGDSSSHYGAQISRETSPLYNPAYHSSAAQPRQRSLANWRPSTGNRRSLMGRHELRSSNRSQARSVIRPGQYGYGKVPSNFKLQGAMARLLQSASSDQPGRERSSREARMPEASPQYEGGTVPETNRRERRASTDRSSAQRNSPAKDQVEGSIRVHLMEPQASDGQRRLLKAPGESVLESPEPRKVGEGVKIVGSRRTKGLALEEGAGDVHRRPGLRAFPTSEASRPHKPAPGDPKFSSPEISASIVVYPAPDVAGPIEGVLLGPSGETSHRAEPPAGVKGQPRVGDGRPQHSSQLEPGRREAGERRGGGGRSERPDPRPAEPPRGEAPGSGGRARSASNRRETPTSPRQREHRGDRPSRHRSIGRARRQEYRDGPDARIGNGYQEWNSYRWSTDMCPGAEKQYKTCSLSVCPSGNGDPRKAQCAGYNHRQFMGRYYEWEPFTEVRRDQRCELNCRPSGYRFYVRHADQVLDGTPCDANSTDVCVSGVCLTPGCDGMLGSDARPDQCGVCGGDGASCQRVFGMFEDSQVNVGYHKIVEIPKGATKINVTEVSLSQNYLALRSRSGHSIINGNWAIDRPGAYQAAGTTFVYTRPTESRGESFYSEGPTTEILDVYMIFQQDNPGIHYEFVLPVKKPAVPQQNSHYPTQSNGPPTTGGLREVSALESVPAVSHRGDAGTRRGSAGAQRGGHAATRQGGPDQPRARGGQRDRRLQVYHTDGQEEPIQQPPSVYRWTSQSATECSVSCGKGFHYPIFRCVAQDTQELVLDAHCDSASRPASVAQACNTHPCPAFWSMGSWSQCSKSCGRGLHHRQILCRQGYANRTVAVHPHRCGHLEKPNTTQSCETRPCTHWQIHTDWESCSVPCGLGQRKRSIRCVSNQGNVVGEGECSGKQKPTDSEACDMGPCVKTWFHTDWSSKCSAVCGIGVQKRAVLCLNDHPSERSPASCEGPRPPDTRACTRPHCQRQVRWYAGPWNQCPIECGNGTQNRDLICVVKLGNNFTVTAPSDCAQLDKPPSVQPCSAGPCDARWFLTGWSECSKPCMGGVQMREVKCLDVAGYPSSLCEAEERPSDQRMCNGHPCGPQLDESCKDKHHNCPVVVQARLCVYSYYKMVCCASCTHAERRGTDPRRHGGRGRRGGG